jgi:hypothetical protein
MHSYIHTYTHTHTHTHTHIYIYIYVHTYTRTYIHTYTHTYTYTYMHAYIHTYVHTCMHTYVHTHIHTYIHAQVQGVPPNSEPTYWHATAALCLVADSFAGSSLSAAAAGCPGGFHVKWDTLYHTNAVYTSCRLKLLLHTRKVMLGRTEGQNPRKGTLLVLFGQQ